VSGTLKFTLTALSNLNAIYEIMIPRNMLDLQKLVLENVYENGVLFEKELRKSLKWLVKADLLKLYNWAIEKFDEECCNIINCVFSDFDFQNLNPLSKFVYNKV
jgi:hypothetical protein